MSGPRLLYTLVAASAAACNAGEAPPPSAREASAQTRVIAVRDAAGTLTLAVELAADRGSCRVSLDGAEASVVQHGERTELDGAGHTLALEPGPAGPRIVDGSGAPLARVVSGAAATDSADSIAIDILDPDGVARVRVRADAEAGDAAILLDRASAPTGRIARDGGRFVATGRDGAVLAYVQGPADLAVAAILSASSLDASQRGLLACNRLLTTTRARAVTP